MATTSLLVQNLSWSKMDTDNFKKCCGPKFEFFTFQSTKIGPTIYLNLAVISGFLVNFFTSLAKLEKY